MRTQCNFVPDSSRSVSERLRTMARWRTLAANCCRMLRMAARPLPTNGLILRFFPTGSAHVAAGLPNPPTPRSGVRGAGRNREDGSFETSIGRLGAGGSSSQNGSRGGWGHGPAPLGCMKSCIWPRFPARGAGRGVRDHFEGSREPPSSTFGVRNWILRRPQHGLRSFPRRVSTTTFPWGRR